MAEGCGQNGSLHSVGRIIQSAFVVFELHEVLGEQLNHVISLKYSP